MQKLHGIFLYCMLAFTPMYGMLHFITYTALIFPYVRPYFILENGALNTSAVKEGQNILVHFLSRCIAKFDSVGGDILGLWNGPKKRAREEAQANLDEQTRVVRANCENEKRAALLTQEELFMEQRKKYEQENDQLKRDLFELKNEALLKQKIAEVLKEKDKEIEQLKNVNQDSRFTNQLKYLQKENADLKSKLEQRSMFTNIHNSFTLAAQPTPSTCPNCSALLNQKLLRNEQ